MSTRALARLLLLAYPPSLRREHGADIAFAIAEGWRRRRGVRARLGFAALLASDVVSSWRGPSASRPAQDARRRGGRWPGQIAGDVKNAFRMFSKSPGVALSAVMTLGLGIAAVTAIFSLADATLLRPFPFPQPERVVQARFSWSQPDFRDLADRQRSFASLAAWTNQNVSLEHNGKATTVPSAAVSGQFFPMVGMLAVRGRLIGDADDRGDAPVVAVISERLWRKAFDADPRVVGATVHVNRQPVTIVGIAPAAFRGLSLTAAPELYVPLGTLPTIGTGFVARMFDRRNAVWLSVGGRLAPSVRLTEAAAEMDAIYRGLHPPKNPSGPVERLELEPIAVWGPGAATGTELGRFMLVLLGASFVTLLLSCATVANLLMMRAEGRQRELAVRAALGAGRGQIVRLLLIESVAIGLAGGAAGLGLARLSLPAFEAFSLPGRIRIDDLALALNPVALLVGVALGFGTSLVFGLAPLWQSSRLPLVTSFRDANRSSGRQRLRLLLVGVQVAVCTLLLAGGLAFARAIRHGLTVDLGFATQGSVMLSVDSTLARYSPEKIADLQARTLDVFSAQPWVGAAGWASVLPLRGRMSGGAAVEDRSRKLGSDKMGVDTQLVSTGYFEALQIPMVAGRSFSPGDRASAPPVAIVSEALARQGWPDGRATGQRITNDPDATPVPWLTVVGVAKDIRRGVTRAPDPTLYVPLAQHANMLEFAGEHLIVRSPLAPDAALRAAIDTFRSVDPLVPIGAGETMEEHVGGLLMAQRLGATLFALFAIAAVILTGFGLYAVIAYAIAHRTREIGIRLALGAERATVLGLVARQGVVPIAAGLVAGGLACWWAGRAIEQFLFALPAVTGRTVVLLAAAIAGLSAIAMLIPARRALAIDPAVTLRSE